MQEGQLKPAYENQSNLIVYITMVSRGASSIRHGCSRELRWSQLDSFGSAGFFVRHSPDSMWSVRWLASSNLGLSSSQFSRPNRKRIHWAKCLTTCLKEDANRLSLTPCDEWSLNPSQVEGCVCAQGLKAPLGGVSWRERGFLQRSSKKGNGSECSADQSCSGLRLTHGVWSHVKTVGSDFKMANKECSAFCFYKIHPKWRK